MLRMTRRSERSRTIEQTVSLCDEGGAVMLSLDDGEGHAFRQALDAHDTGLLLAAINRTEYEVVLCQGDLVAKPVYDGDWTLHLAWHDEHGGDGLVKLAPSDENVFEEALKGHCRMLMREEALRTVCEEHEGVGT